MYTIAENEITTVNGLGDTAVPASVLPSESSSPKSGSGIDWTSVINTGLQQGSNIAQTAINAHNQTGNSNTNTGGNYAADAVGELAAGDHAAAALEGEGIV